MRKRKTFALLLLLTLSGCMRTAYHAENNRYQHAVEDWYCLEEKVDLPPHPLALEDLIQIGLQENLELQVYCQEIAIQHEIATGEILKILPTLVANGEDSGRNRNTGSASQSLTERPPAPPSISREQNRQTWDVTLEWNLLDFGISYYRSRQEANKTLVKYYEYERARQKLIFDISQQYWKAVMSRQAVVGAKEIIEKIEQQQRKLTQNVELRVISETTVIEREDNLVTLHRALMAFDRVHHQAMLELKRLAGLPPQQEFTLVEENLEPVEEKSFDLLELEQLALQNRPELYTNDFQEKVSVEQVREAYIRMFPGVSFFWGGNYDADKFLLFHHWMQIGVRATWDLLRLPSKWSEYRTSLKRNDLSELNRLALSMAVIAQVNLAHLLYREDFHEFEILKEHDRVKGRRLEIAERRYETGLLGEEELVRYQGEALQVKAELLARYANLQISLERLNNAVGLPRYYLSGGVN